MMKNGSAKMKKIIAIILTLFMILGSFAACNKSSDIQSDGDLPSEEVSGENDTPDISEEQAGDVGKENENENDGNDDNESNDDIKEEPVEEPVEKVNVLDGKKIIFIGNSHTYYGKTVLEKTQSVLTQDARSNDKGYFYQICKNNGAEVAVTNWTFGNHGFSDLFENCSADRGCNGVDHLSYLTDRAFDYVVMQYGTSDVSVAYFLEKCSMVMDIFKAANPDVKFIFLVSRRAHEKDLTWLAGLKELAAQGVTIVDWGGLVDDLITGEVKVPNTTLTYNQNSFIVSKSASDGYHPNMLTGYITSLMTYCAITGENAEGQGYSFCGDMKVNRDFRFSSFISSYYTYNGATTNFHEIFESENDMKGIQQLVDTYLAEKEYMNY